MKRKASREKYNGKKLEYGQIAIRMTEEAFVPDTIVVTKEEGRPWEGFNWEVHDSIQTVAHILFNHCEDSPSNRLALDRQAHEYRIKYGTPTRFYDIVTKTKKGITIVTPSQGTEDKSARTA